ncbi:transposase [Methylomonas montana]|uniref:REP-associated tyrosine transposase n=1 Tax=Methylomonas montana TaxID=3058963 RepID=UPI002657B6EC|nr:transposase [Methylomonas montana]WKJ89813.1 transposase [Methylomonas montana]
MRYRRSKATGASYFFTVNLANRQSDCLVRHIETLREITRTVKNSHPFAIEAMVVLPDHIHAIWRLPENDADYPVRWSLIKAGFSRQLEKAEFIRPSRQSKRERGIWQRRYWEHQIKDDLDFERHVDYIHYNPVKHGYAKQPIDWPFSSVHRYVRTGVLSAHWGADLILEEIICGER